MKSWTGSDDSSVLVHPIWPLIPWVVFSLAVAHKIWRLAVLVRQQVVERSGRLDRFRQRLERIWEQR